MAERNKRGMRPSVFFTYLLVSLALSAYSEVADTGPTFWLEELQDAILGGHYEKASLVVATIAILIALMLLDPLGRIVGPESAKPPLPHGTQAAICALIGGVFAVAAAVGGVWIHRDLVKPPVAASLEVRTPPNAPPAADLVELTGIIRTDLIRTLEESRGDTKYVPVVGWAKRCRRRPSSFSSGAQRRK